MTAHKIRGALLTGAHRSPVALQTLIRDVFLQQAHIAFITVYNILGGGVIVMSSLSELSQLANVSTVLVLVPQTQLDPLRTGPKLSNPSALYPSDSDDIRLIRLP